MNQLFCLQHRGDRYLGMTAAMTQVPVPTALKRQSRAGTDNAKTQGTVRTVPPVRYNRIPHLLLKPVRDFQIRNITKEPSLRMGQNVP